MTRAIPKPRVSGAPSWQPEYSVDFRTLAAQTISADGTASIDGKTWLVDGTSQGSFKVGTAGKGLEVIPTAGGYLYLHGPALDTLMSGFKVSDRVRQILAFSSIPVSGNGADYNNEYNYFGWSGGGHTLVPFVFGGMRNNAQALMWSDFGATGPSNIAGPTGMVYNTLAIELAYTSSPHAWFTRSAIPVPNADVPDPLTYTAAGSFVSTGLPFAAGAPAPCFGTHSLLGYEIKSMQIQRWRV